MISRSQGLLLHKLRRLVRRERVRRGLARQLRRLCGASVAPFEPLAPPSREVPVDDALHDEVVVDDVILDAHDVP